MLTTWTCLTLYPLLDVVANPQSCAAYCGASMTYAYYGLQNGVEVRPVGVLYVVMVGGTYAGENVIVAYVKRQRPNNIVFRRPAFPPRTIKWIGTPTPE